MKYGLYLPNFGAFGDARTLATLAREAEDAGWDGLFIWDHVTRPAAMGAVVDPWIALSAMAMNTSVIKMGALVTPLPRRRPWKVARETVSLDRLSDGRLIFGVGIGSSGGKDIEWNHFGEEDDLKKRGAMLDEGLDILTGLWSGQTFQYNGTFYQVKNSLFLPTPVQSPRIPIWVAGFYPAKAPLHRAARWDGMFPLFDAKLNDAQTVAQFSEVVTFIKEQRGDDKPFDFVCRGSGDLSKDVELAAAYREAGATWWLEGFPPSRFGAEWLSDLPLRTVRERIAQGPLK